MFPLGEQVMLAPRIGLTWMDDSMVDYFYGVRPAEATASRAAYEGSASINVEAGLSLIYVPWENHMFMLNLGVTQLGGSITDSPIVVDDLLATAVVGYVFKF